MYSADGAQIHQEPFYPEDINSPQLFQVKDTVREKACSKIKFIFESNLFNCDEIYRLVDNFK